jgi:hypothetical protein
MAEKYAANCRDALAPPRRVSAPISNPIVDRAEVELRVRFQWPSGGQAGGLWHGTQGWKMLFTSVISVNEPRTNRRT